MSENNVEMEKTNFVENQEFVTATKPKANTKLVLTIVLAVIVVVFVVVGIVLFLMQPKMKFNKVKNECSNMSSFSSSGSDYFELDTYPEAIDDYDFSPAARAVLLEAQQERVINAIKYANNELGFGDSVYRDMLKTTALMGRQTAENSHYSVSWTYHPNNGLEVTYRIK